MFGASSSNPPTPHPNPSHPSRYPPQQLSQNEVQKQIYLSQLIQYQSNLFSLQAQLSAGRQIGRPLSGSGRSVSVDGRFQSARSLVGQQYQAESTIQDEVDEEIARTNPLVASALARRKKRQSQNFELAAQAREGSFINEMVENTGDLSNLDFIERESSPTSNTPSLILSRPGEYSSESGESLNSDGSSNNPTPASSRESVTMTKREEGRKALERLGNGRPAQTRALVAALSRQRPSSLNLQSSTSDIETPTDSFFSALSPLATTFSPPSFTPIQASFPSSPNPYRSTSSSQYLAVAIRKPFGPAPESEFLAKNFSSRISSSIRKNALDRIGKRDKVEKVEKVDDATGGSM